MSAGQWQTRLTDGNCLWEWHDQCLVELEQIEQCDRWGHGRLISTVRASERGEGLLLDHETERCATPIPTAPRNYKEPVWIGELCKSGGKVYRRQLRPTWELRIFFAIPVAHPRIVVGVAAFAKRTDENKKKAGDREAQRIRDAMDRAKWLFGEKQYELAPL